MENEELDARIIRLIAEHRSLYQNARGLDRKIQGLVVLVESDEGAIAAVKGGVAFIQELLDEEDCRMRRRFQRALVRGFLLGLTSAGRSPQQAAFLVANGSCLAALRKEIRFDVFSHSLGFSTGQCWMRENWGDSLQPVLVESLLEGISRAAENQALEGIKNRLFISFAAGALVSAFKD